MQAAPAGARGGKTKAEGLLDPQNSGSRMSGSDASKAGEASPSSMQQYRMLSAMRTSQLQERLQALSARDPRLGVEMVLQRSPQATKE
eukprot:COSAG04_NODE_30190_length_264_cov_0.630303_1_plen_87_part_11